MVGADYELSARSFRAEELWAKPALPTAPAKAQAVFLVAVKRRSEHAFINTINEACHPLEIPEIPGLVSQHGVTSLPVIS